MARNPRVLVLFILVFFLLFAPDPQVSLPHRFRLDDVLGREYAALNVLNHTRYGGFDVSRDKWLNITGFRKSDGFAWDALRPVQERVRQKAKAILGEDAAQVALGQGALNLSLPVYRNVSGFAKGKWVRSRHISSNLSVPILNRTALGVNPVYGEHWQFHRNITGESGTMRFQFNERDLESLQEMDSVKETKAQLMIRDESASGDWWDMTLHGLHYLDVGAMVLTTTSDKFAGMFGLPQFSLSEAMFNQSTALLNQTIRQVIDEQANSARVVVNPWTSSSDGSSDGLYSPPHCEYIVYVLQHPLNMPEGEYHGPQDGHPLDFVENELRHPTGYFHLPPPNMKMEAVVFSPDCGFVLESQGPPEYAPADGQHLLGPKLEVVLNAGRWLTILFGAMLAGEVYLGLLQMKEAATPSTRSRISFYTIAVLSMGDGFTALVFLPLHLFIQGMFLNFLAVSFFAFFSVTFLDLRFLMDIWFVQDEERRRQERHQSSSRPSGTSTPLPATPNSTLASGARPASSAPPPSVAATPAAADTLPLPPAARPNPVAGATPIIIPSDQDEPDQGTAATIDTANESPSRRFGALYTRFYALLLVILFLSLYATSWPIGLRTAYTNCLALLYLSPWIPQIYRNTMRNCRKALLWKYVLGQSLLRLMPVAYFYAVYDNVLLVENDRGALLVLAGWVWVQVWALVVQSVLGPRVFVKSNWVPPAYDYHPVLREDEEEAMLPIGFTQATETNTAPADAPSPSRRASMTGRDKGKRAYECAICMQDIEVPIVPAAGSVAGEGGGAVGLSANLLARRAYMVTPCRHIFHTPCLEGWMRFRLQCPICRETLPPL